MLKIKKNNFLINILIFISGSGLLFLSTGYESHYYLVWFAFVPILLYSYENSYLKIFIFSFTVILLGSMSYYKLIYNFPHTLFFIISYCFTFSIIFLLNKYIFKNFYSWINLFFLPSLASIAEYCLPKILETTTFGSLSYTQIQFKSIIQIASVTGIYGITFLIFLVSNSIALGIYFYSNKDYKKLKTSTPLGVFIFLVCNVLGFIKIQLHNKRPIEKINVGFLNNYSQLNQNSQLSEKESKAILDSSLNMILKDKAKIVFLPEKIVTVNRSRQASIMKSIQNAAIKNNLPIIFGIRKPLSFKRKFNSVWIFSQDGNLAANYDKNHLVPKYKTSNKAKLKAGISFTTFTINNHKFGVSICRDMEYQHISKAFAKLNVPIVFVPALDKITDNWVVGRIAVFRGIEGGFSTVRSSKQGELIISDMTGSYVIIKAEQNQPYAVFNVSLGTNLTFYSKYGNWFVYACLLFTFTPLFYIILYKKRVLIRTQF